MSATTVTVWPDPTSPASRRAVPADLEFAAPPPGMAGLHRFTLAPLDETGLLFALRSTEAVGVRLFVVPPRAYFPGYSPRVDATTRAALGLDADSEPLLLVVVHPGQDGRAPTANLLAPVVVDPATGAAAQVVLDGDEWPLRAPLTADGSAA